MLRLKTGLVDFPIEFDNGDTAVISFNPTDPKLSDRLFNAQEQINERVKNIKSFSEDVQLEDNGSVSIPKDFSDVFQLSKEQRNFVIEQAKKKNEVVKETEAIIFDEIDKAFNSKISEVLFSHCSPFDIQDGEYYFITVLRSLADEIRKYTTKNNADAAKKMSKYIGKYMK